MPDGQRVLSAPGTVEMAPALDTRSVVRNTHGVHTAPSREPFTRTRGETTANPNPVFYFRTRIIIMHPPFCIDGT